VPRPVGGTPAVPPVSCYRPRPPPCGSRGSGSSQAWRTDSRAKGVGRDHAFLLQPCPQSLGARVCGRECGGHVFVSTPCAGRGVSPRSRPPPHGVIGPRTRYTALVNGKRCSHTTRLWCLPDPLRVSLHTLVSHNRRSPINVVVFLRSPPHFFGNVRRCSTGSPWSTVASITYSPSVPPRSLTSVLLVALPPRIFHHPHSPPTILTPCRSCPLLR